MIKSIFFDLDDTLIATYEEAYRNHVQTASKLGLEIPSEKNFFRYYGLPWKKFIEMLWPNVSHEEFTRVYGNNITRYPLIAGVDRVLDYLKGHDFFLGILTTRDAYSTNKLLEIHRLSDYFDEVVCCSEHIHKPDPRSFEGILRKLNHLKIKKQELLYTGDSLNDFKAAYHARISFVGVLTGYTSRDDFIEAGLNPKDIIGSVKELPTYLKRIERYEDSNLF